MRTHFYTNGDFRFRVTQRNDCVSWDVWPIRPGPAVALGFTSKGAAIAWLDAQVAHSQVSS